MNPYVDGFLLVVPQARLDEYRQMSHKAGEIWREYGALDYLESVDDDLMHEGMVSFRERMQAGEDERVIFAWITYPDREARDRINAAVMADPRLKNACPEGALDMKRFHWGGFAPLVHVPGVIPAGAPAGVSTLTPHLVCDPAARAIAFYCEAFGAEELGRVATDDGRLLHAMLRMGDSTLMLNDPFDTCMTPQEGRSEASHQENVTMALHLYVTDVDAVVARAVAAGAEIVMPVADQFWGDRYGQVRDPFGHRWSIATRQRDVPDEEMKTAVREMFKN